MFGGRLHLRIKAGQSQTVMTRLEQKIKQAGGTISILRPIAPQLEDVFIALLENGKN